MNSIMKQVADQNYACSASKAAAIVKGLFGLKAEQKLKTELQEVNYISISFDGSTFHSTKVLPIIAIFFNRLRGLQHRLLAMIDLKQGTSDYISWAVKKITKIYRIENKITAIVADNCRVNYGNIERQGNNNVFYHLTET